MQVIDLLRQYATFNHWAHKRLLGVILTLPAEHHHTKVQSSFDSLYKTVYHVWGAETLWLARLNLKPSTLAQDPFNGSMQELSKALETIDLQWIEWFENKQDADLTEKIHYKNMAGLPFYQPYDLLLQHIFNHSTYHNGQLVTMLRALGVGQIPPTDFIFWARIPGGEHSSA